jgi:hypothetical protein
MSDATEAHILTLSELHQRLGGRPGVKTLYRHWQEGLLRGWKEGSDPQRHGRAGGRLYFPASELTAYPERMARLRETGQR